MYYISYGSNMNLERMAWRCPRAKRIGNGKVKGWRLVFNYHADIAETGIETDYVPVVVWDLSKGDEKNLDRYEGYPTYYVKKVVPVTLDNGKVIRAMVYVMSNDRKGIYPPERGYYLKILTGYFENGVDIKPLEDAISFCRDRDNITEHNQYNPA